MKIICLATVPATDHDAAARTPGLLRYVVDRPADDIDVTGYPIRAEVVAVVTAVFGPGGGTQRHALPTIGNEYVVEEHVQWDYERTWPDGTVTPGIKQISFLKRLPGTSRADFAEHWTAIHTQLARKHHPTIWRYVQNVVIENNTLDGVDIDGIAELSFHSIHDWRDRKYDSDEGRQKIVADVQSFIDVTSLSHRITRETILRSAEVRP